MKSLSFFKPILLILVGLGLPACGPHITSKGETLIVPGATQKVVESKPKSDSSPEAAEPSPTEPSESLDLHDEIVTPIPEKTDRHLVPTVYYTPITDLDKDQCGDAERLSLKDLKGESLVRVCPGIAFNCGLQGSCILKRQNEQSIYNVIKKIKGEDRYVVVKNCAYGLGVHDSKLKKAICLDPYFTVAADLKFHRPGDVIFVPKLVGVGLPSGHKHNGYLVVRDKGRAIKGADRFDFFSGTDSWKSVDNPFKQAGLTDKNTNLVYQKVDAATAQKIRIERNYPELP
jgi:3D (Asp-Asp-Asp) domain-containing protein